MLSTQGLQAVAEKGSIRVRFDAGDARPPVAWQLLDPETGVLLFEGQDEAASAEGRLTTARIPMPAADGPYRLHVFCGVDTGHFITMNAVVDGEAIQVDVPRIANQSTRRWQHGWRTVPNAFSTPVRSLWSNRRLIRSMVQRDMLARYRGSFGGALWTVLTPLMLMGTYAFVFGFVLDARFTGDPSKSGYVLYFLAGMLPWLAFSEAVGRSPSVILEYRSFVNKLVFPLDILPMNLVFAGLVTEAIGLVIFLIGLLAVRHSIPESAIWLPLLLIPQVLLTAGLGWLLSATGVFVRDLGQLIGFVLTLWFFLTPIGYEESKFASLPAIVRGVLSLNPILILVRGYRTILLENHAPWAAAHGSEGLLWLWGLSVGVTVLGYAWFARLRRNFADVV